MAVSSVLVTGVGHAAEGPELGVVYDSNGEGSSVWVQTTGGVHRIDPDSLAVVATGDEYALTGTLASSRFWLGGFGGLTAVGPSGDTEVNIPWLYGNVTGRGSTVWLVTELGLITVDAS